MSSSTDLFFYIFGLIAACSSLNVVIARNPITSAFSLVVTFFSVSAIFVLMQAHFLAALQIFVYAGAIMVLFVFVIMLLNADMKKLDLPKSRGFQWLSAFLCTLLFSMIVWGVNHAVFPPPVGDLTPEKIEADGGNVLAVSTVMFSDHILSFELTSILVLVGIVGSVALAKRKQELRGPKS